jgi:hypothetical protein
MNMSSRIAAAKHISLTNNQDMLEVCENLKDVTSVHEFKQTLRAAMIAQQFTQSWNMSMTALESFLINTNFLAEKMGADSKGVSILSAFFNHVLFNSQNWRSKKDFLDVADLISVWAAWHPGHISPVESKEPKGGPSGANSNKKQNNSQVLIQHLSFASHTELEVPFHPPVPFPEHYSFWSLTTTNNFYFRKKYLISFSSPYITQLHKEKAAIFADYHQPSIYYPLFSPRKAGARGRAAWRRGRPARDAAATATRRPPPPPTSAAASTSGSAPTSTVPASPARA